MASTDPKARVTAHDVAARAGVSQPTVSLVLSGNPRARVSAATRERVIQAARELDYRPNLLARGLVTRRSYALGLVVPDVGNPFYLEVIRGVERVAAEQGYAVLLCDARHTSAARHLEMLQARLVDGIIIDAAGAASVPEQVLEGLNVVLIGETSERWPGVTADALAAGRVAAEHLLGLGHQRIGFIGPATDAHAFRMRERGFAQALRAAGISLQSEWLRRAPADVDGGQAAMRTLLAGRSVPTAVFCVNDLVALGALKACMKLGIRVPEDLSLLGCDDIEMSRVVTPELSTVAVPSRELGARAARLLLQRLEGKGDGRLASRPLPIRLVVRGTTAAPQAQTDT